MSKTQVADEAEYLKDTEVAALLRFSVNTVRLWRCQGNGPPFFKLGEPGTVRYRRADIEAWLEARKRLVTDGRVFAKSRQLISTAHI